MVTAIKDRTILAAIARIPRARSCPRCIGGRMFVDQGRYCLELKCLNCGHVVASMIVNPTIGRNTDPFRHL